MEDKSRNQLLEELYVLRKQVAELKRVDAERTHVERDLQKAYDELVVRVEKRTRQLRLLQEINNSINVGMPLNDVLQMATEGIREIFDYTACDIFLLENDKKSLILVALSVGSDIIKKIERLLGLTVIGYRIPLFEGSHFFEVVSSKKVYTLNDPVKVFEDFTDNKKLKLFAGQVARIAGFKSVMVTPLLVEGEVIGVIGAARKEKIASGDADVLVRFASQMALAIRKKQTEAALQESEEKYRDLYDNAPDMYHALDENEIIIDCNETGARMLGYEKEKIIGMPVTDFIKGRPERLFERGFPSSDGKKVLLNLEKEFVRKDGTTFPASLNVFAKFDVNGKLIGTKTISRDVTERKRVEDNLRESEERYRSLVESAKDVIFTLSDDGTLTSLNSAFETITGWSREEWIGKAFSPIIHPDDLPLAMLRFQKTLQGETVPMSELRVKVKSGGYLTGEFKTTPQIQNGKTVAMLGIVRDVTERRRAEEEMKKRLMKFRLEDGNLYLVNEPTPDISHRGFEDIVKVGYYGLVISRTPEKEFRKNVEGNFEFSWLAESGGKKTIPPNLKEIELKIKNLPRKNAVLIDRLDYLISREGFEETLSFIQRIGEVAYLARLVVILSIDPLTVGKQELRLLMKETLEIEPRNMGKLPEDLFSILRFIYEQNTRGIKPSYTDIGKELRVSKPTTRKRLRGLILRGYMIESKRGMHKVVELTEKGRNLFFK